jgi:hypothetical protein
MIMFNLFNRKSKIDKLYDKYFQVLGQAKLMSANNRKKSDELFAESNRLLEQIQRLQQA